MSSLADLLGRIHRLFAALDQAQRYKAVDAIEWECDEMRHVFALLVMGQAVGLPTPPAEIALELLPEMEEELRLLISRLDTAQSPFSRLYSSLPVD